MPREELVVAAREGLALVLKSLAKLPSPRRPVSSVSLYVASYPPARAISPRLSRSPCHMSEASLSEVGSVNGMQRVLGCPPSIEVGHPVTLHPEVRGGPPDGYSVIAVEQAGAGLDGLQGELLPRSQPIGADAVDGGR